MKQSLFFSIIGIIIAGGIVGFMLACRGNTCFAQEAPTASSPLAGDEALGAREGASEGGPLLPEEIEDTAGARVGATVIVPPHPVSLPALFEKQFDGRDLEMGRVLAENPVYTRYFITYKSGPLTISGIMNVPKGAEYGSPESPDRGGPFPLFILNHGYIDPAIYTNGRGLKREQDYLARRGYVVMHPDYRNHAESDDDPRYELDLRLGYVEDVINAVYAARASGLPFLDASRVGMLGHSMGGGITLNVLAVQPDLVEAAVLFAPVSSDYRDNFEKWTRGGETGRGRAARIIEAYGAPEDNPEFWREVSVRNFFDRMNVPIMNHHGNADESVPLAWSQATHDALLSAGKDSQLFVYDGEPHEFINAWPQVMQRTVEFFDKQVKDSKKGI